MFPDYDISMLIGFLVHLEYCQKITDQNVMKLLSFSLAYQSSDEYLFFPGLVSISKVDDVWTNAKTQTNWFSQHHTLSCMYIQFGRTAFIGKLEQEQSDVIIHESLD